MIRHFNGPYHQHGGGFGGFFRGIVKFLTPLAETVKTTMRNPLAQQIAKEVVKTGVSIGSDVISGRSFKDTARENIERAKKRVADTVLDAMNPNDLISDEEEILHPPPAKRPFKNKTVKRKNVNVKTASKKRQKTIFD